MNRSDLKDEAAKLADGLEGGAKSLLAAAASNPYVWAIVLIVAAVSFAVGKLL